MNAVSNLNSAYVAVLAGFLWVMPFADASEATNTVKLYLNGTSAGRTFEGIGALSAGASSRLLIDYPEPQRTQILDFLFKPKFGAALHHLKVEIGGDINSTDGSEPSHMHTRKDENCQRGYEWWLMAEAKKRNPDIMLECLEWGAPAWIGNGKFESQDNADYIVKFIKGAKRIHNVDIDYVGVWNERHCDVGWIKLLRKTLDENDLKHVKINADDAESGWRIVDAVANDPKLANAVGVMGSHYPRFTSPDLARELGKSIWSSEDGAWLFVGPFKSGHWCGARELAKQYNRNYVIGRMTKTVTWSLITSYYDNLAIPGSGLMYANTPWSGFYDVQQAVWAAAHTTQFVHPGWKYMDCGCFLIEGGSVVTLRSPDSKDYSIIIETMDAKAPQRMTCTLWDWPKVDAPLHVWHSNTSEQFAKLEDIVPAKSARWEREGGFTLTLDPESIYSLTTTTGQQKGAALPPPDKPFPLPYAENFESYAVGSTPRYMSDQAGSFEVVNRLDGKGKALRQVVLRKGIEWAKNPYPETLLGSLKWKNYAVSVDTWIETNGFVSLFGRVGKKTDDDKPPCGYWLKVADTGVWELAVAKGEPAMDFMENLKNMAVTVLMSGRVSFPADVWHNLKLRFEGSSISIIIDEKNVGTVEDKTFSEGMIGIGCGWHGAQFDNLLISTPK